LSQIELGVNNVAKPAQKSEQEMSTHQSQLLDLSFVKMPNKTWDSKQNTRATT